MEDSILLFQVVLEVVELPNDSAECDGVLGRFFKGNECGALVAGTASDQEVDGNGEQVLVKVKMEECPEDILHVYGATALQLLRE